MRTPNGTDLAAFALSTLLGANLATIEHPVRTGNIPSYCSGITEKAAEPLNEHGRLSPGAAAATFVEPFLCTEETPFNPAIVSTKEAWVGAALADTFLLGIYGAMGWMRRRRDDEREDSNQI